MRMFIIYNDNLKPGCCRATDCKGSVEIPEQQAYFFHSDKTFMCKKCFKVALEKKHPWVKEAELIQFRRRAGDGFSSWHNKFDGEPAKNPVFRYKEV